MFTYLRYKGSGIRSKHSQVASDMASTKKKKKKKKEFEEGGCLLIKMQLKSRITSYRFSLLDPCQPLFSQVLVGVVCEPWLSVSRLNPPPCFVRPLLSSVLSLFTPALVPCDLVVV